MRWDSEVGPDLDGLLGSRCWQLQELSLTLLEPRIGQFKS